MKLTPLVALVAFLAGSVTGWLVHSSVEPGGNRSHQVKVAPAGPSAADLAAIEKLHQEDVAATLSGRPSELAKLWTEDAVRLEPGAPAEVGKKLIAADDVKDQKAHPGSRMVSYVPHIEDLKVAGGWAYEWDYFDVSFRESPRSKTQSFHAKALRVLRRRPDGSWKFAAVMWNMAQP